MRKLSSFLAVGLVVGATFTARSSFAEGGGRVITISEVTIVGRVQKPIAAVDVSRIQPRLTLAEVKQTFSDKVEQALYRAPF